MKPIRPARYRLAREIRVWSPGKPIPTEALRFASSCACFASETDSAEILGDTTNYPFLIALATEPETDPAVVDLAVDRALLLHGPTRVFADLSARYRSNHYLRSLRVHKWIWARIQRRSVWVRGLEVQTKDFRRAGYAEEQAGISLMEIAQRVRRGMAWEKTQAEYGRRYHCSNGCPLVLDLGSYVTSEGRDEKNGGRELMVPAYHLPRLLRAKAGDVVIMTVRASASDYTTGRLLLWQVLEVYSPTRDRLQTAYQPLGH